MQTRMTGAGFDDYKPKPKRKVSEKAVRLMHANELIDMYPGECGDQFRPICRNHIYRLFDKGIGYDVIEQRIKDFIYMARTSTKPWIPYANTFFKDAANMDPMSWIDWIGDGCDEEEFKRALIASGVQV